MWYVVAFVAGMPCGAIVAAVLADWYRYGCPWTWRKYQ